METPSGHCVDLRAQDRLEMETGSERVIWMGGHRSCWVLVYLLTLRLSLVHFDSHLEGHLTKGRPVAPWILHTLPPVAWPGSALWGLYCRLTIIRCLYPLLGTCLK
jgi:hypothetical protein